MKVIEFFRMMPVFLIIYIFTIGAQAQSLQVFEIDIPSCPDNHVVELSHEAFLKLGVDKKVFPYFISTQKIQPLLGVYKSVSFVNTEAGGALIGDFQPQFQVLARDEQNQQLATIASFRYPPQTLDDVSRGILKIGDSLFRFDRGPWIFPFFDKQLGHFIHDDMVWVTTLHGALKTEPLTNLLWKILQEDRAKKVHVESIMQTEELLRNMHIDQSTLVTKVASDIFLLNRPTSENAGKVYVISTTNGGDIGKLLLAHLQK